MYRVSRLLKVLALLLLACSPLKAQNFLNVNVPVQGQFATITTNAKFSFYGPGVNGNSVAYIMAVQPGTALTVYVTAKSATFTGTDQINVNFFATGNPNSTTCAIGGSIADGWTAQIATSFINGAQTGQGSVNHYIFGAATTAFGVTGILSAAQVCVQIINNATFNSANDTFDMYASFTPNALPTGSGISTGNCNTQTIGIAPTENPCLVAGSDSNGNIRLISVDPTNGGVLVGSAPTTAVDGVSNGTSFAVNHSGNQIAFEHFLWNFNGTSWDRNFYCSSNNFTNTAFGTTTPTQAIALGAGIRIRICSVNVGETATFTGNAVTFSFGTGVNCATGNTPFLVVSTTGTSASPNLGYGIVIPASNAVCIQTATATPTLAVTITFAGPY